MPGRIERLRVPLGPGVRLDSGVEEGGDVPPYYDSLVAKLIVWDEDRPAALARAVLAEAAVLYEDRALTTPSPSAGASMTPEDQKWLAYCQQLSEQAVAYEQKNGAPGPPGLRWSIACTPDGAENGARLAQQEAAYDYVSAKLPTPIPVPSEIAPMRDSYWRVAAK